MIADCETCDRKQVPCKACEASQRAICYICQGDVADPYCEQETDTERNWLEIRNELDRTRAERDSWEAQFHSAAAAASEYSEFWEKHHGDFDQFGNYIPHSQIDGDLRAAKAEIVRLRSAIGERS